MTSEKLSFQRRCCRKRRSNRQLQKQAAGFTGKHGAGLKSKGVRLYYPEGKTMSTTSANTLISIIVPYHLVWLASKKAKKCYYKQIVFHFQKGSLNGVKTGKNIYLNLLSDATTYAGGRKEPLNFAEIEGPPRLVAFALLTHRQWYFTGQTGGGAQITQRVTRCRTLIAPQKIHWLVGLYKGFSLPSFKGIIINHYKDPH